jgi:hypothetical protein
MQVQPNLDLQDSVARWHTPSLSQVLVLLLAFSYAYLTHIIKILIRRILQLGGTRPPYHRQADRTERSKSLLDISSSWLARLQCQSR